MSARKNDLLSVEYIDILNEDIQEKSGLYFFCTSKILFCVCEEKDDTEMTVELDNMQ